MGIRRKFFAASYDFQIRKAERAGLTEMRRSLLAQVSGRVLEVGGGTGANLAHYSPAVISLTVTEPDVSMIKRLERRARAEAPATTVLRAPAEDLPFEDRTFDVVVSTLVLCGVDDQPRALREIPPGLEPAGAAAVPRARPVERRQGGEGPGPAQLVEPPGRVLRVQPAHS